MTRAGRIMLLDTGVLADQDLFARYYDQMSQERKNKIDAIKADSGKRLSLGAGILLKWAMKLAGEGSQLKFGPQGKPYIAGRSDFFFNLSHSGSLVAIAVSDREVGVDIQKMRHFDDRLVNYVFNIEDRKFVKEMMDDGDVDRIYTRMWAIKESVMKYNGKGIAMEPQKIALRVEDGSASCGSGSASGNDSLNVAANGNGSSNVASGGGQSGTRIRISHPDYDCSNLFISEYSCRDSADVTFYGLAVCSEYEDFGELEVYTLPPG